MRLCLLCASAETDRNLNGFTANARGHTTGAWADSHLHESPKSRHETSVASQRFEIGMVHLVDVIGDRSRCVWSRLERRGGSLPRSRPSARFPLPSPCCASRFFACSASFARTSWLSDRSVAAASTAVRAKSVKIAKTYGENALRHRDARSKACSAKRVRNSTDPEYGPVRASPAPSPRYATTQKFGR